VAIGDLPRSAFDQFLLQQLSGTPGVWSGDDAATYGNPGRPCREHLVDGFLIDMTDGITREFTLLASLFDVIGTDCHTMFLGLGLEDGADTDVIRTGQRCSAGLLGIVGRESYDGIRPKDFAGLMRGDVLLSEVHPIGSAEARDLDAIVDDQQGSTLCSDFSQLLGSLQKLGASQ
jgi:hypothetical protein